MTHSNKPIEQEPFSVRDARVKAQEACAICGATGALHRDHCHATGAVRMLLCPPCNKGLGHFRDNPELLRKAAEYIEFCRTFAKPDQPAPERLKAALGWFPAR